MAQAPFKYFFLVYFVSFMSFFCEFLKFFLVFFGAGGVLRRTLPALMFFLGPQTRREINLESMLPPCLPGGPCMSSHKRHQAPY